MPLVLGLLGAALVSAFAVVTTKSAVRLWRGRRDSFSSVLIRGGMDPERALSYDRAILSLATMFGSGTVMLFGVGINSLNLHDGGVPAVLAVAGFACFMLSGLLFVIVRAFNRPKILVPPSLRREPGTIALRRHGQRRNIRRG